MTKLTALEIADKLDYWTRSVMSIHNVPTLPKLCDCGEKATDMLRQQHAEIERLTALNSALTNKANVLVIANARLDEKIDSLTAEHEEHAAELRCLTAERDAAAASAVLTERTAIAAQLRKWADELGFDGSSWRWKTPGGLLYRAAEMVSDRTKP